MKCIILLFLFPSFGCNANNNQTANKDSTVNQLKVVELFTSEGCSSCPSAEKALQGIALKDTNILLLSFHVDYWNRLGWTDTFSSRSFSERQYAYSQSLGSTVYTPQAVINGETETVGSNIPVLKKFFQQAVPYENRTGKTVATITSKTVNVTTNITPPKNCSLVYLLVQKEAITHIKAGENEGSTLRHKNIVRQMATTTKDHIELVIPSGLKAKECFVVVLTQQNNVGKIIGASAVQL